MPNTVSSKPELARSGIEQCTGEVAIDRRDRPTEASPAIYVNQQPRRIRQRLRAQFLSVEDRAVKDAEQIAFFVERGFAPSGPSEYRRFMLVALDCPRRERDATNQMS
jgi:hypothetical protein